MIVDRGHPWDTDISSLAWPLSWIPHVLECFKMLIQYIVLILWCMYWKVSIHISAQVNFVTKRHKQSALVLTSNGHSSLTVIFGIWGFSMYHCIFIVCMPRCYRMGSIHCKNYHVHNYILLLFYCILCDIGIGRVFEFAM